MNNQQISTQVIGVDLGGSAIKLGRYDALGNCYQSLTVPTPQAATPEAVFSVLLEAILQITKNVKSIGGIGIGLPGPVDATGRISQIAINLKNWQNVPLADWIEAQTNLSVVMANDANCAGLGEAWLGAGCRFKDLILLTLGTGVGGAIILNGELFVGRNGTAGELGLITLNFDGPVCNSGNQGSLEQYASVQAIRRETGLEPAELAAKAKSGDTKAIEYWQQYGRRLGAGLASLIYILTPEAIILGGGISAGAELFLPSTLAEIEQRVLVSSRQGLQVLVAELGNQAGAIGAAKLALDTFVVKH
ncbi:ROK family protein [Lyngbya sp. PCC 8106]|uniref:ROK family protein n=1 Tax=Lyngbya sp. (strain PCC 8106) TaxID=313612 RepID=UPI0000EAC9D2|nr:ROK family protein [Lyngbya sp. PCC 8106]EAW38002.1 ROK [Lyngbya sp. PCC 8106]